MQKLFPRIFITLTLAFFLSGPAIVLADGVCDSMKIAHVGMDPSAASGIGVFLKNESGRACGSLSNGSAGYFLLSTRNTDQTLAVILTAASLKKNIWVYYTGDSDPRVIAFLQVLNIAE